MGVVITAWRRSQLAFLFRNRSKNRFSRWPPRIPDRNDSMHPTKFQVKWPFDPGEEAKNNFSKWPPRRPSWISDRNDFSYFDLQVTKCFLPSFKSICLLVQEKRKERFSRWGHLGFLIGTILAIFIYQSPRCFLPSFGSVGLLFQEKKRKIDLAFPIGTILATSHPDASYQVSSQLAFWFRRSSEK